MARGTLLLGGVAFSSARLFSLSLAGGIAFSLTLGGCFAQGQRERVTGEGAEPEGSGQEPWAIGGAELADDDGSAEPPELEPRAAIEIDDDGSVPVLSPLTVTELSGVLPATAELVGLALHGDPAHLYVLDARAGLYELTADDARLVFDLPASRVRGGTGDGSPPAEVTDIAFDPYRGSDGTPTFALTAQNDGYLLSLPSGTLDSHFCYFPPVADWEVTANPSVSQALRAQGIQVVERTEAVAVSSINGQIFAQHRTLRVDGATVAGSELFVFDTTGGQPLGTRRFARNDFVAGGAAFLFQAALVLGSSDGLYVSLGWMDNVRRVATVSGVTQITGIASRPGGNLVVLDGPRKRLLELDGLAIDAAIASAL